MATLKARVAELKGIPVDVQRLLYSGKQLDENCALQNYGIQKGSFVHLVICLMGGGTTFADVSNEDGRLSMVAVLCRRAQPCCNPACLRSSAGQRVQHGHAWWQLGSWCPTML